MLIYQMAYEQVKKLVIMETMMLLKGCLMPQLKASYQDPLFSQLAGLGQQIVLMMEPNNQKTAAMSKHVYRKLSTPVYFIVNEKSQNA